MKQPITRELYAYWRRLKGARSAPDRSDIDPVAIRHVLADTFMIKIDPQRSFPLKLCGTRLNALWLAEQNGRSFLELWEEGDRGHVTAALMMAIDAVAPVVVGARSCPKGVRPLDLELLLLPLRHFGKTHSRLLGSLVPVYQPDWLGRTPTNAMKLNSLRVISADENIAGNRSGAPLAASAIRNAVSQPKFIVYDGGKLH